MMGELVSFVTYTVYCTVVSSNWPKNKPDNWENRGIKTKLIKQWTVFDFLTTCKHEIIIILKQQISWLPPPIYFYIAQKTASNQWPIKNIYRNGADSNPFLIIGKNNLLRYTEQSVS